MQILKFYVESHENGTAWSVKDPFGRMVSEHDSLTEAKSACKLQDDGKHKRAWFRRITKWISDGDIDENELEAILWSRRLFEDGKISSIGDREAIQHALLTFERNDEIPIHMKDWLDSVRQSTGRSLLDAISGLKQLYFAH